jgi:histidine ammonia-lyase
MVFNYGVDRLNLGILEEITSGKRKGILNEKAISQINQSAREVQKIVENKKPVYGINTGLGQLCDISIPEKDILILQSNILQSHACGVGKPIPRDIAKKMLITKVHSLAMGYSGVRLETLNRILWHIEEDIIPLVPEKGSVGASGDLAPLAHLFLPLIGMGKVQLGDDIVQGSDLYLKYNKAPLILQAKESLGLINGTQFILSYACSGLVRFHNLLEMADLAGALSLEGLMGSIRPFDPRIHALRPYKGTEWVAQKLFFLLKESNIVQDHQNCERVQDPYSIRCMPQVHGASRNAWLHLKELTEIELNSITDNPIIFDADDSISGGNFHGQPLAMALDYASLAAAELGNISDRRSYLLTEGRFGLPKLLVKNPGLNSGLMIPQYTSAALVSENKSLCFPASADSIPTSLGQEDHVSMGSISSRKLHQILDNLEYILAIELLYATQALDFRRPLQSTPILEACYDLIRGKVPSLENDRILSQDIEKIHQLIIQETLWNKVLETIEIEKLPYPHHEEFRIY